MKGICNFNLIKSDDYSYCLNNSETINQNNFGLKSKNHEIFLYKQNKKALTCFDDKRIYESNGIVSYPHGYKVKCLNCDMWILKLDEINKTHIC